MTRIRELVNPLLIMCAQSQADPGSTEHNTKADADAAELLEHH